MKPSTVIVLALAISATPILRAQPGPPSGPPPPAVPGISPVPLWPSNGDVSRLPASQYVFFSPETGEYIVSYPEDMNSPQTSSRVTVRLGSHAAVEATVTPHVAKNDDGTYSYTYVLANGTNARLPVAKLTLLVPANDLKFKAAHPAWRAVRDETDDARDAMPSTVRLGTVEWNATAASLLGRGAASTGFALTSGFAPGFTTVSIKGQLEREHAVALFASLPKAVATQLELVMSPAWDSQLGLTLGPRFPRDVPQLMVADNFNYGIGALVRRRALNGSSAFVVGALDTLSAFLQSGGIAPLGPDRLAVLAKAAPGLEAEIAESLRLSLLR